MDPAGARELEAAGIIDSKFGAVTLFRRVGGTEAARACLRFYRHVDEPKFRLSGWSCLGEDLPARRTAIGCMLKPADPADSRKRCKTDGIVRPCRNQAQRLRDIRCAGLVSGLGDGRRITRICAAPCNPPVAGPASAAPHNCGNKQPRHWFS
jgi:hypothetical protein